MLTVVLSLSLLLLLALIAIAAVARRRQFLLSEPEENFQPHLNPPRAVALFAPTAQSLANIERENERKKQTEQREKRLEWASLVEFADLAKTKIAADENFNDEALGILTERAVSEEDVRSLIGFVLANNLNANKNLIESYQQIWQKSPDPKTTANLFRLAAQSNETDIFLTVFIEAERLVKTGELELTEGELYELAESHHWLLSNDARISGAGFLLKQKLADLRRELTHN